MPKQLGIARLLVDGERDAAAPPTLLALRTGSTELLLVGVLLTAAFIRIAAMTPPGYALDEEITSLAVDSIRQHGVPLFPSGALNDRGLAYSYVAWAAGWFFGYGLSSYRVASLLAGVLALLAVYRLARLAVHETAALAACALLAVFPLHIEVSAWARFYSVSTAAYLAAMMVFLSGNQQRARRVCFYGCVLLNLLSQELSITLVVVPLLAAAVERDHVRQYLVMFGVCGVILALTQLGMGALHALTLSEVSASLRSSTSVSEPTILFPLIEPFRLASPAVLVFLMLIAGSIYLTLVRSARAPAAVWGLCVVTALLFQLGLLVLVLLCGVIFRPERTRRYLVYGGVTGVTAAIFWTIYTSAAANAMLSVGLMRSLTTYSLSYPWDAVFYIRKSLPLTALTLGLVVLSLLKPSFRSNSQIRLLLMLTVINLVLLGIVNVPLRSRYFLLSWPIILVVVARGLELISGHTPRTSTDRWSPFRRLAALAWLILLAFEHYHYGRANPIVPGRSDDRFVTVRRVDSGAWAEPLSVIPSNALIISNDELACAYHAGRSDYWLVLRRSDFDQYAVPVGDQRRGLYGNGVVISTPEALFRAVDASKDARPIALVLFDTGRFEFSQSRELALQVFRQTHHALIREAPGIVVVLVT